MERKLQHIGLQITADWSVHVEKKLFVGYVKAHAQFYWFHAETISLSEWIKCLTLQLHLQIYRLHEEIITSSDWRGHPA